MVLPTPRIDTTISLIFMFSIEVLKSPTCYKCTEYFKNTNVKDYIEKYKRGVRGTILG